MHKTSNTMEALGNENIDYPNETFIQAITRVGIRVDAEHYADKRSIKSKCKISLALHPI